MAEEAGLFSFDEVADGMSDKMVARHPHVFGDENRDKSAEQQTRDWETIKPPNAPPRQKPGGCWTGGWRSACPPFCAR